MKEGWEMKKLGEVCLKTANIKWDESHIEEYHYIDLSAVSRDDLVITETTLINFENAPSRAKKIIKSGDVIFATTRPTLKRLTIIPKKYDNQICSTGFAVLRPNLRQITSKYLFYALLQDSFMRLMESLQRGASYPAVTDADVKGYEIPLPPLVEQRRIVSILDEAFTAINQGKAHAEKNLQNAKEIFESYLQGVFEKKGDDWEEKKLEDCFKMKSGDNLTAKNMIEGKYPVFGGNGISGYHNKCNLSGSNVIIGRVGALCGNVRHITESIWLTDNAFKLVDFKFKFDHSFLTYLLNYKDLRSYARQAAQPVISNSSLKEVTLNFPKYKPEQERIVSELDALRTETQKLETLYQQKLADLEELKKSILQKAFAGEL